jgi:Right handed beta helix region
MPRSMSNVCCRPTKFATALLAAFTAITLAHQGAFAAALPDAPKTFDTTYAAPGGATLHVGAGGDLQAVLDRARPGDTIVLEAGATFTGPFTLPNKTSGSGWIYIVSSKLQSLPGPGHRVGPQDASSMPRIVPRAYANALSSALVTVDNSHHFRFVGIDFASVAGPELYTLIVIGNQDASPATLAHHIVFDRCYVHGEPGANNQRGISMDGAYVAVVDSYISDFQEVNADTQALWAHNTTGPLQIRNNYIEAAGENVMFGGADSRSAELVPADIEIVGNHFYKPLSLIPTRFTVKNLLEFKAAQRVLVSGNVFENNPAKSQQGFAIVITPRNQSSTAPWSATTDITVIGNTLINVGSGFNLMGHDSRPTLLTERILIRDNIVGVTGLNGADGRAFQFVAGGSDYTIDHNTIVYSSSTPPTSDLGMAESTLKISNFVFTNNLATHSHWGFFGSGVGEGTAALDANFSNWTFSRNVMVDAPAGAYPAGNFFPGGLATVRFRNFAAGSYALAADSPYKNAATDGTDIGANGTMTLNVIVPDPPTNVAVR